ncbi:glycosyltransferase [Pedobacter sp. SYSU D00535]|uniref:glycosyltransferase n=1 Tax=Pedobacter sp. SYSU D00535 TaxID=2810308 RepID=UPI001A96BC04|nr:glycosyltransferase [Pedobacter sp. SYSU D00535]
MKIIFFTHPTFIESQSMPRYASWLARGMREKGHQVELWAPQPQFFRTSLPQKLKKWAGYLDQYIIFPNVVRARLKELEEDTLFVFTDHALGPWVPLVSSRKHVIHCHDFLAQRSALGEILENKTKFTGQLYQKYIRKGYQQGKNFISISNQTRQDLHSFLERIPELSEVIYNGLTGTFMPSQDVCADRRDLSASFGLDVNSGFLLHVGGNQWYKNRVGVVRLYNQWRNAISNPIPLLLVGSTPDSRLRAAIENSPYRKDIGTLEGVDDAVVKKLYRSATVFLFPSLAEGFGWPIIEAMSSGVPVLTTGEAPMTEVGGDAATYIRRMPASEQEINHWASEGAKVLNDLIERSVEERGKLVEKGFRQAAKFRSEIALDRIEEIYRQIVKKP